VQQAEYFPPALKKLDISSNQLNSISQRISLLNSITVKKKKKFTKKKNLFFFPGTKFSFQ
jgi:hypothetical protein